MSTEISFFEMFQACLQLEKFDGQIEPLLKWSKCFALSVCQRVLFKYRKQIKIRPKLLSFFAFDRTHRRS